MIYHSLRNILYLVKFYDLITAVVINRTQNSHQENEFWNFHICERSVLYTSTWALSYYSHAICI